MSCNDKNQSAIAETRDQLFVDTSDGGRLDIVTGNNGLFRPPFGFGDDEWRAFGRKIGLTTKQITKIFRNILEICIGPQFNRVGNLSQAAVIGDKSIYVIDSAPFIQLGFLVLDGGTANEEIVQFCFIDRTTHRIYLDNPLTLAHNPIVNASDWLVSDTASGATSLVLRNSSNLPTSGFPYTISLGRGALVEELIEVTANTVGTNTLTVSALVNDHRGFRAGFVRKVLLDDAPAGRVFIRLDVSESREFPDTGWLRIDSNTANEEIVFFDEKDVDEDILFLTSPLLFDHVANDSVELMFPGEIVETGGVVQVGKHWDIFDTDPKNLRIFVQDEEMMLRLRDASWLHGTVPAVASTVTTAPVLAGDFELPVDSVRGFPNEAGLLDLDTGTETVFYILRKSGTSMETSANVEPFTLVNGQTLILSVDGAANDTATFNTADFIDITNATAQEVANVINQDITGVYAYPAEGAVRITSDTWIEDPTASIEVVGGTANPELGFDTPTFILTQPLVNSYLAGTTVDLFTVEYPGTDLEEGGINDFKFPGPYIFDISQRAPSETVSELVTLTPPPTRMAFPQLSGFTNIEVEDASLFDAPPFSPYSAKIGRDSGFEEDRVVTDRTLQGEASSTVTNGPYAPGATTIDLVSSVNLPETSVPNKAGYRVIIDEGGGNEEIIRTLDNDVGTGTLTVDPLVSPHANGETVGLLNDILTLDTLLKPHAGPSWTPTKEGQLVEKLVENLELPAPAAGLGFPNSGIIYINFGNERYSVRSRIVTVVSPTVYELRSTDEFPTTDFPYQVILGQGLPTEELVDVSANNTGLDELTVSTPVFTHFEGEYITFISGRSEVVEYQDIDGVNLMLDPPQVLGKHTVGESVMLSPSLSNPSTDGYDYPFYLPADPLRCVRTMFEIVRAAGVTVTIIGDR